MRITQVGNYYQIAEEGEIELTDDQYEKLIATVPLFGRWILCNKDEMCEILFSIMSSKELNEKTRISIEDNTKDFNESLFDSEEDKAIRTGDTDYLLTLELDSDLIEYIISFAPTSTAIAILDKVDDVCDYVKCFIDVTDNLELIKYFVSRGCCSQFGELHMRSAKYDEHDDLIEFYQNVLGLE